MKKVLKRITALVLVLAMAFVFVPSEIAGKAYADVPEMPVNFDKSVGDVWWEAYPEAYCYDLYINDVFYMAFEKWDYDDAGLFSFWADGAINEMVADGDLPSATSYELALFALSEEYDELASWSDVYDFTPTLDNIENLRPEYGTLYWDTYPDASYFYVGINSAGDDEWIYLEGNPNSFELETYMDSYGYETGHYTIRVEAFNEYGYIEAVGVIPNYEYTAPEYGEIKNVKISEAGIMTWDPVEGVGAYYVGVDNQYWDAVAGTTYDLHAMLDSVISNGIVENRGNHTIAIETDNPKKIYRWEGKHKYFYNNVEADTVFRYFGSTRFETSLKVAQAYKDKTGYDKLNSVILAYGYNYADALAGSYLSSVMNGPIILVDGVQSHIDAVQKFIKENLNSDGTVYMLGGSAVVPDKAVAGLSGYNIDRLWGSDRYETNLEILKEGDLRSWWPSDELIVCSGASFADSLSAAATGARILLVKGNSLNQNQMDYLNTIAQERDGLIITVVGGEGAVSKAIFNQLTNYGLVDRVGGMDRYETSRMLAEYYFGPVSSAVLAYGANFPDGLCGGSLAKAMGAPLILTANGRTQQATAYVKNSQHIMYGAILGGPTLISDASAKAIFDVSPNSNVVVVK